MSDGPLPEETWIGAVVWEAAPEASDYSRRGGPVIHSGSDLGGEWVEVAEIRRSRGKATAHLTRLYVADLDPDATAPYGRTEALAKELCACLATRFDWHLYEAVGAAHGAGLGN